MKYWVVIQQTTDAIRVVFGSSSYSKAEKVYNCLEKDVENDEYRPYYYISSFAMGEMRDSISKIYEKWKDKV